MTNHCPYTIIEYHVAYKLKFAFIMYSDRLKFFSFEKLSVQSLIMFTFPDSTTTDSSANMSRC